MRLDHLLSKEHTLKDLLFIFQCTLISTLKKERVKLIKLKKASIRKNSNIWAHSSDG